MTARGILGGLAGVRRVPLPEPLLALTDPISVLAAAARDTAADGGRVLVVAADEAERAALERVLLREHLLGCGRGFLVFGTAGGELGACRFNAVVAAEGVREAHAAWWEAEVAPRLRPLSDRPAGQA